MRKFTLIAATALVFAMLPLGAAAAPPGSSTGSANAKTHTHWLAGSVSAVGTDSLSVGVLWTGPHDGQLNGQSVTLAVDANTAIVSGKDKTTVALSTIKPGDLVGVKATSSDKTLTSLTASQIRVYCNCHWIGGTVSAIGSSSISVQVARTGPYDTVLNGKPVTIQVDSSTTYIGGKAKSTIGFSDLKVGDGIGVIFSASGFFKAPGFDPSTATFVAKRVHLWQKKVVPSASSDSGAAAGTQP
jgi:Domain of unknown function (DUF5666)